MGDIYKIVMFNWIGVIFCKIIWGAHGRTGRKKLGGGKKFARLFRIVPALSKKIFRRNFTKLTEFPTKLTEFVPFIFIIILLYYYYINIIFIIFYYIIIFYIARLWSQYCPTGFVCPTNWGGGCRPLRPPPGTPMVDSDNNTRKRQRGIRSKHWSCLSLQLNSRSSHTCNARVLGKDAEWEWILPVRQTLKQCSIIYNQEL
jgi:hypothetical protein